MVGGMIAAIIFSLLFVPSFFVIFQWLGERGSRNQSAQDQDARTSAESEQGEKKADN